MGDAGTESIPINLMLLLVISYQRIKVYSNLPEVELFVNGKSCGKKNVENCLAVFDVVLPFGSSTLEAKGFGEKLTGDAGRKDGKTEDVMNIRYNPLPDQAYKAGSWGYIGGENKSTTSEIQNTFDGCHYRTAFKRRYIVRNNNTSIHIHLKSLQGKAFLNGIKIRKLD